MQFKFWNLIKKPRDIRHNPKPALENNTHLDILVLMASKSTLSVIMIFDQSAPHFNLIRQTNIIEWIALVSRNSDY